MPRASVGSRRTSLFRSRQQLTGWRLVGSPFTLGVRCSLLTAFPRSPPVYTTGVWCPEAESIWSWGLEVSSGGRPAACSGGPACLPPLNGVKTGSSGLSQSSCKTIRRRKGSLAHLLGGLSLHLLWSPWRRSLSQVPGGDGNLLAGGRQACELPWLACCLGARPGPRVWGLSPEALGVVRSISGRHPAGSSGISEVNVMLFF